MIRSEEEPVKNGTEKTTTEKNINQEKNNGNLQMMVTGRVVDTNKSPKQKVRDHLMLNYEKNIHPVLGAYFLKHRVPNKTYHSLICFDCCTKQKVTNSVFL